MKTSKKLAWLSLSLSLSVLVAASALAADEIDVRTQERVRDAIFNDARVRSYALVVEVAGGVATIRGVVGSEASRTAVTDIAGSIEGVREVRNDLLVRPDVKLEDSDIELYVQEALSRDPRVESSEITITSLDGVVELYGTVDSREERDRAAKVAAHVLGVKEVKNDLTVPETDRFERRASDEALTAAIEQALGAADLGDVEVLVERGVATLHGAVTSPEAKARAAELAFAAGATLVRNEIGVGGPPPP